MAIIDLYYRKYVESRKVVKSQGDEELYEQTQPVEEFLQGNGRGREYVQEEPLGHQEEVQEQVPQYSSPEEYKQWNRVPHEEIFQLAEDYMNQMFGESDLRQPGYFEPLPVDLATQIAQAYDSVPMDDSRNPEVRESYEQFAKEVQDQFDMLESVVNVRWWTEDPDNPRSEPLPGQPYQSSGEMFAKMRETGEVYIYVGGDPNEFMEEMDENGVTINEKFRAIHDVFGHAKNGFGFGPRGEWNAWVAHSQMFSPLAFKAMTTETVGQNAWFNFSEQNSNLPVTERDFAPQKTALLPDEILGQLYDYARTE